jgi:uncharacterized protein YjbI with pentapeptide repeats
MDKSSPENKQRFSQEQYDMLKRCSDKKDMAEWNEWRAGNPDTKVLLEGALLDKFHLRKVNLKGAYLFGASLAGALLSFADLENAVLLKADLRGSTLFAANLKKAKLGKDCEFAEITSSVTFKDQFIFASNVKGFELGANLRNAIFVHAKLGGCDFSGADIRGTDFRRATVDAATIMQGCKLDPSTDFRGVALGDCWIEPGYRQLLEYNIRRMNWERWYKQHKILKWPVWLFWLLSDYGISTWRVVTAFLGMAMVFAIVYWMWPSFLIVRGAVGDINGFIHALYFSVVTMTTLGFGDIAANPDSWGGQVLVMIQVILGYVLLGAIVTRFAVLFTAGGPADTFTKKDVKPK